MKNITETKVVNLKYSAYDVYIGRGSIFGNEYAIGRDGNRQEVIDQYAEWFYDKCLNDDKFYQSVLSLRGKVLGCYCKPLSCHGDVIISYLREVA